MAAPFAVARRPFPWRRAAIAAACFAVGFLLVLAVQADDGIDVDVNDADHRRHDGDDGADDRGTATDHRATPDDRPRPARAGRQRERQRQRSGQRRGGDGDD